MLTQVDLIRGRVLRSLNDIRIYISCLPVREEDALQALGGKDARATHARIVDYILQELGHPPSKDQTPHRLSLQKAKGYVPKAVDAAQ